MRSGQLKVENIKGKLEFDDSILFQEVSNKEAEMISGGSLYGFSYQQAWSMYYYRSIWDNASNAARIIARS